MPLTPYYEHGGITIYHGDCREILPRLEPVDLVLTDPPYSISLGNSATHVRQPGKGKRSLDFFNDDSDWGASTARAVGSILLASRLCSNTIYAWCGHRQFGDIVSTLEGEGWKTRPFVLVKAVPVPAAPHAGFDSGVELCVFAYKTGKSWNNLRPGTCPNYFKADSYRHGQPGKLDHPTQKPLSLFTHLLSLSMPPDGIVLDPFLGSGTTLRAAKNLGFHAIGIEIEERYCEIAANRMNQEVLDLSSGNGNHSDCDIEQMDIPPIAIHPVSLIKPKHSLLDMFLPEE